MSESIRDTNNTQQTPVRRAGAVPRRSNDPQPVTPVINNNWYSSSHNEIRKTIVREIHTFFLRTKPNASESWKSNALPMAKKIEAKLYFSSASLEEHTNRETLPIRVYNAFLKIKYGKILEHMNGIISSRNSSRNTRQTISASASEPQKIDIDGLATIALLFEQIHPFVPYRKH